MECQAIIKNLKWNKNKSIGEIVIVVEGESEEFKLLKHIFTHVLDYNYTAIRRNKTMKDKFVSKTNNRSSVIIANTSNSNIKSILEEKDYKEKLYELLKKEYNKSLKNVPIYILWDRDQDSNKGEVVNKALTTFGSAMDNDYEMNGLLLISYPCIESFELSNFDKQLWKRKFNTSIDAKTANKKLIPNITNITESTLLLAVENMHRVMYKYGIRNYDTSNFKKENLKIFKEESKEYSKSKTFTALSLISILFIDLGIITETENR